MGKSGKNTRTYFIDRKNVDFKIHSESSSSVCLVQGRTWDGWTPQVRGLYLRSEPKPCTGVPYSSQLMVVWAVMNFSGWILNEKGWSLGTK